MMATIFNSSTFNSAILDSAILHKTLTPTTSIWLKLIHSHTTWWWQPSWILPSWIQPFCTKKLHSFILTHTWWLQLSWYLPSSIQPFCTKKTSLIHSDSTWWWQPSWILSSWIQPFCTKKLHSFILTQLVGGSHLEFCHLEFSHLGFSHLCFSSQTRTHLPRFITNISTKKLHSFILTQLDDGSHLEFCHLRLKHFHLGFKHLVIFSQIHSKTLSPHSDSDSN